MSKETMKVWAEYNKDDKTFTGNVEFGGPRPIPSDAYKWLIWKRCTMTLTEIKKEKK